MEEVKNQVEIILIAHQPSQPVLKNETDGQSLCVNHKLI